MDKDYSKMSLKELEDEINLINDERLAAVKEFRARALAVVPFREAAQRAAFLAEEKRIVEEHKAKGTERPVSQAIGI